MSFTKPPIDSAAVRRRPDPQQQTCKVCGRPDKFDFRVPSDVWARVVGDRYVNRVVCLSCFDDLAREVGQSYADRLELLYFAGDGAALEFRTVSATDLIRRSRRLV